jgi:two-component system alkaline phosphatase synthesis response regulator PhoP
VLLIDDEKKLVLGLKAILEREGCMVFTAHTGEEGLQMAKQKLPDMIICDVMMPPPNGFLLKRALQQDKRTASIPFIFMTARTSNVDKIAGLNLGADDYITKPFNVDELLARMQAVMRRTK